MVKSKRVVHGMRGMLGSRWDWHVAMVMKRSAVSPDSFHGAGCFDHAGEVVLTVVLARACVPAANVDNLFRYEGFAGASSGRIVP
ncbi:hypothetical protein [Collinsella tanakaei]|uniref:hypothetical protein n=1 Tax=Collinsella tanakaei TaxID=626935 RepID=UPI0025A47985|nr:hypothetical protein [Collinsella tanakaei]MDM8302384.1 hypothetical protein [Collinsella tanakaei]